MVLQPGGGPTQQQAEEEYEPCLSSTPLLCPCLQLMTELLSGIRVLKFFRWEQALGDRVKACRSQELGRLRVIKYLDAACVYLWAALPVVICIVIFITYVLLGHQLTATKVRAKEG